MNPTKEFRDYLISQGAALVGIGDLTAVPSSDYPVGIAVAIPLPKHVIKGLQLAPTREYYELYNSLSDKLNTIITASAKYLTDKGYHAYARTTDQEMTDPRRISHFLTFLFPFPSEFFHIPFRLFRPDLKAH